LIEFSGGEKKMSATREYYQIKQIVFDGNASNISDFVRKQTVTITPVSVTIEGGTNSCKGFNINNIFFNDTVSRCSITIPGGPNGIVIRAYGNRQSVIQGGTYNYTTLDPLDQQIVYKKGNQYIADFAFDGNTNYQSIVLELIKDDGTSGLNIGNSLSIVTYTNLIGGSDIKSTVKIGIEGYPNTAFNINTQELIIGKTGRYEISDAPMELKRFGVCANESEPFVVTIKYK
jgi:hypothetical protein